MITRFALFEGRIHDGQENTFREAILTEVLPEWKSLPGVLAVRVNFAYTRDDGAPAIPLILAISYPTMETLDAALASPARARAKAATDAILARLFDGGIHHHVTTAYDHPLTP